MSFARLREPAFQKNLRKQKFSGLIRRGIDMIFSLCALVLLAPLWLAIIILIRASSSRDEKGHSTKKTKNTAIFSHQRTGLNGKPFTLYKFRTMHPDCASQEYSPVSLKDPRITKIGRLLRKTSLDEVPQFWNILKGDMSLVGPRPEMTFITDTYGPLEKCRLLVKPGLTGFWQIAGRKDLPLHENVEFDLWYIENRSIKLDLIILIKTATVIFSGKGAY